MVAEEDQRGQEPEDAEPIPKLPRAPLFRGFSFNSIIRIGMFATLFYAIVVMRKPCADGVARFIGGFEESPDAAPSTIEERYPGFELLTAEEALKRWPDNPANQGDGGANAADGGPHDASAPSP